MNDMTEESFQKELKIFSKHYKLFQNNLCNVFVSTFEDQKSKDIMIEQFSLIASKNDNQTRYIKTLKHLNSYILEAISIYNNDMYVFSNTTFIIDLDKNTEAENILKNLIPVFDFINKTSKCSFHILTNNKQIQENLLETIIYDNRTKVTYFNEGFVASLFLKNKLINDLKQNKKIIKKNKI